MDDGAIIVLSLIAVTVGALCWGPTRTLIVWGAGLAAVIAVALAIGPLWLIALLLLLLVLNK